MRGCQRSNGLSYYHTPSPQSSPGGRGGKRCALPRKDYRFTAYTFTLAAYSFTS